PALDKAMADLDRLGRIETIGAVTLAGGMRGMNEIKVSDPKQYINANLAVVESKKADEGKGNFFKDLKIDRDAKTYEVMTFTHVLLTLDLEKLAQLSGNNPAQAEQLKAMFSGGAMEYWFGTDGKRLLQVMASNWDDARAQVDSFLKGKDGIGTSPGFQS